MWQAGQFSQDNLNGIQQQIYGTMCDAQSDNNDSTVMKRLIQQDQKRQAWH